MATFASAGMDVGGANDSDTTYVAGHIYSVQHCHDQFASTGDTITLPNGTFVWSTGVAMTKAVTLTSLNFQQATIQPGNIGGTSAAHALSIQKSANVAYTQPTTLAKASVRVTGLNFVATTASNCFKFLNVTEGAGAESVSAGGNYQISTLPALIDNNYFLTGPSLSGGQGQFGATECMANGVVFAWNTFSNNNNTGNLGAQGGFDAGGIECHNPGASPTAPSWQSFDSMGTNDTNGTLNIYIEQNTWNGLMDQSIDHADHSRVVIRDNTFNSTAMSSHGQDSGPSGGRHVEYYDNTYNFPISGPINYTGAQSFPFTGTLSTSSQTITGIASTTGILVQMSIVGNGIPANAVVTGVTGTTVTINVTPTLNGSQSLTAYYTYPTNVTNWILHRAATGICTGNKMPDITSSTWGTKDSIVFGVFNTSTGPNSIPCQGNYPTAFNYPAARQVGQTWIGAAVSGFSPHRFNGDTSQTGGTTSVDGPTDAQFAAGIGYVTDPFYVWNNTPATGADWSTFHVTDQSATVGAPCAAFCRWIHANGGPNPCLQCDGSGPPCIGYNPQLATNYIQSARDVVYAQKTTGPTGAWARYTFPHPLNPGQGGGGGSTTPGNGLTAAADSSATLFVVGITSGAYSSPANNYWALFSTQFTAQAKAGALEWVNTSDTNYARVPMGAAGSGWTVSAYASGVGVAWKNANLLIQPVVAGTPQTLLSLGWCDALNAGNTNFFADLSTSVTVPLAIAVVLSQNAAAFNTY